MIKTVKKSVIAIALLMNVQGMEPLDTGNTSMFFENKNLEDVHIKIQDLIQNQSVPGKNILLISDLDGTLTDKSNPSLFDAVKPRGCALDLINFCVKNDINIVLSSAWDVFAETLYRVNKLGLSEQFKTTDANALCEELPSIIESTLKDIDNSVATYQQENYSQEDINELVDKRIQTFQSDIKKKYSNEILAHKKIITFQNTYFQNKIIKDYFADTTKTNYAHLGNVVSVRDTQHDDFTPQYYRNKAFSPLIALPNIDYSQITHVIFVDDSKENIRFYQSDIMRLKEYGLLPSQNTTYLTYHLSFANGEPDLK